MFKSLIMYLFSRGPQLFIMNKSFLLSRRNMMGYVVVRWIYQKYRRTALYVTRVNERATNTPAGRNSD